MPKSGVVLILTWSLMIIPGLLGKLEKISERPSNVVTDFVGYNHVSVIHFYVPEGTKTAAIKFTAKEVRTGGIFGCTARNVTLYIKAGSLPFVNPDNSSIKANIVQHRLQTYRMKIMSDKSENILKIVGPQPGDWFSWLIHTWTDPMEGQIKQQGLSASCDTIVDAALEVEAGEAPLVLDKDSHSAKLANVSDSTMMRLFIPDRQKRCKLSVSSTCGEKCKILIKVSSRSELAHVISQSNRTWLPFKPWPDSFHYVTISLVTGESTNVSVTLEKAANEGPPVRFVRLIKRSWPDFFQFDYEHIIEGATKASPVELAVGMQTVLTFDVAAVSDIGGTVTISLKLDDSTKEDTVIVACINLGYHEDITALASCSVEEKARLADMNVNKSGPANTNIIYPEPGTWHVSLKAFCGSGECGCFKECITGLCEECDCMSECAAKVEIVVGSSPCIDGSCGDNGACTHYMSGGFLFSACQCTNGYRGWDCSDPKYIRSSAAVLASLVFLTFSNLVFIGSIYFAVRREYYTEAVVYTAIMFFSTFYHACEAGENMYHFCIVRMNVLQFCDFYCAMLSIWVTLVAMASLGPRITPFCQMVGAVLLAFAVEMDRTALWVFMMPAAAGLILIIVAWGRRCRSRRTFKYPEGPYRTRYLPVGLGLVGLGLLCYAFLQTRSNYWVVHSLWHMAVAVGVMLLLPERKSML